MNIKQTNIVLAKRPSEASLHYEIAKCYFQAFAVGKYESDYEKGK